MTSPKDFGRVGDLLGDVCEAMVSPEAAQVGSPSAAGTGAARPSARTSVSASDVARTLAAAWPRIAGAEVAANAVPVQLKGGRLVVSTSSSVWAHTLQYMADDLMCRLNECLGPGAVKQIVFRHAGWEERVQAGAAAPAGAQTGAESVQPAELSRGEKEALEQLKGLDLPPAIREAMERAMKASFVRSQRDSVR